MAQLNITLNQDEILQLLSADREDAFRTLLQESLNSVLKAESQRTQCLTPLLYVSYYHSRLNKEVRQ